MTKTGRRKKLRKHLSSIAIAGIIVLMLGFVSVASMRLKVQNEKKLARIEELNGLIAEEEETAEEIKEYEKYMQTKKWIEEMAKKLLNLVYPDEIIFKAED